MRLFLAKNIPQENGYSDFVCERIFNIKVTYESWDQGLNTGSLKIIPYHSLYVTFLPLKSDNFWHEWLAAEIVGFELEITHTKSIVMYDFKLHTVSPGSLVIFHMQF